MEQNLETVELVTRPTNSTQFYLFNLFADYIMPRGGAIWTNDLLYLLKLLGVSERAARSTLSRMKRRGWFVTHREGRESQYVITEAGQAILEEGDERIFEGPFTGWDGRWHLIVYSLPEERRKERNELRKKLVWLGFGNLAPGTWISPHGREEDVLAISQNLGVDEYVTVFTAETVSDEEIVDQCWDIGALEAEYAAFVERYRPAYERLTAEMEEGNGTERPPEEYFLRRFHLTYDFQTFPRKDPNLPTKLLPADWVGHEARELFMAYRRLLKEGMGDFMEELVGSDG